MGHPHLAVSPGAHPPHPLGWPAIDHQGSIQVGRHQAQQPLHPERLSCSSRAQHPDVKLCHRKLIFGRGITCHVAFDDAKLGLEVCALKVGVHASRRARLCGRARLTCSECAVQMRSGLGMCCEACVVALLCCCGLTPTSCVDWCTRLLVQCSQHSAGVKTTLVTTSGARQLYLNGRRLGKGERVNSPPPPHSPGPPRASCVGLVHVVHSLRLRKTNGLDGKLDQVVT